MLVATSRHQLGRILIRNSLRSFSSSDKEFYVEKLKGGDQGLVLFNFNRKKRHNALSRSFVEQLNEALEETAFDSSVRVVIVRSLVPGTFCAGADLQERLTFTQSETVQFVPKLRSTVNKFSALPVPVIAAIDGFALGGGLEIALACDIRVVSKTAKLGLVETKVGILPGAGGTQRLPRLINPSVAKELIFTARTFDGEEAKSLGVANHAVDQNETGTAAYEKSLEVARKILENAPVAVRLAKAAINNGLEVDIGSGLSIENANYMQVIPTRDRIEGLQAFKEKRPPRYKGE